MAGHLFVSHSTRDGASIARALVVAAEATGQPCWFAPRNVKPGIPYPEQIVGAIEASVGFVVIVTPAANESTDVLQEVQLAAAERKLIAPVIVGATQPSPNLRYYIGVRHQIRWSEPEATCLALMRSFNSAQPDNIMPSESALALSKDAGTHAPGAQPTNTRRVISDAIKSGGVAARMVVIPRGEFMMGSPPDEEGRQENEGPQRLVTVPEFAAGVFPVTWDEYLRAVDADACPKPPDLHIEKGPHPVTHVSWHDAQAYCSWLSRQTGFRYRLLSEAEWEYAARAGTQTPFFFGSAISKTQANFDTSYLYGPAFKQEGGTQTTPVGRYPANAFGLYDMHGNVREWVEDVFADSYLAGQPSDGQPFTTGPSPFHVGRGGAWSDFPVYLRCAYRGFGVPGRRFTNVGFRVARSL